MALYRFLFAPALLAVALVAGSGERARPGATTDVAAQVVRATPIEVAPTTAHDAVKPAGRPSPRAERARAHPVR